jgi:methionyl-tRNA formyltransferase
MPRSVVVLGKGTLAIRIADWFRTAGDWDLLGVVPVVPEPDWTPSISEWADREGVPSVASGMAPDALDQLLADGQSLDLAFSVFYDRILRPDFLDAVGRTMNLHNGPLPRYRGVSPINWALKNAEPIHGLTIHDVSPGIDDGPIVAQTTFTIYPEFDEVIDVYRRALEFGWVTFQQTMPLLERIEPRPQEGETSYYDRSAEARLGDRTGFTIAEAKGGSAPQQPQRLRA